MPEEDLIRMFRELTAETALSTKLMQEAARALGSPRERPKLVLIQGGRDDAR